MRWRLALLLAATLTIAFPHGISAQRTVPHVPKEIVVPPGYKLLFSVEAKGVQIYKAAEIAGKLKWVWDAPLADLFDERGGKVGCHYDGPAWEAADGSKLVLDATEDPKSFPAPKPNANIPWLLLRVKAAPGVNGAFSSALYIQRLETSGGKAPTEDPRHAGTRVGVPYRAIYYVYGTAQ